MTNSDDYDYTGRLPTRALVLHPWVKGRRKPGGVAASEHQRLPEARLDEIVGLAAAIELDVVHSELVAIGKIHPGTLLGAGKIKDLGQFIKTSEIELVVVDWALSPVQQRNLERAWKAKVIDRSGLILEIFGDRAQTREGKLQVDLAHLTYQKSRLVRSWTHLERQRGGVGFLGGPGETQIEADRRMLDTRITKLRRELETVRKTRLLQRKSRERVPHPVIALVGYTNAGKSTLFNRITHSEVFAEDLLFATLDPTMRGIELPSGKKAILSDTVGFISELPTHLIAAFRATLEEVLEAEIVVHVRDLSHPDTEAQLSDVEHVLRELGIDPDVRPPVEVWNKIDLLEDEAREVVVNQAARDPNVTALSALTGQGCEDLLETLDNLLTSSRQEVEIRLELSDGANIAWLYKHGEVINREDEGNSALFKVRLDSADLGRFEKRRAKN